MITPEQLAANPSEHSQQTALFCWAAQHSLIIPELRLLFAIPNGGLRDKVTASRLKAEGVRSGVPDIFWPVAARMPSHVSIYYHGLFIEMKAAKGRVSEAQTQWVKDLEGQGYACATVYAYHFARDVILNYWEGKSLHELRVLS